MPRPVHFEFAVDDPDRAARFWSEAFGWAIHGYAWGVGRILRVTGVVLVVYAGMLALTAYEFNSLPTGNACIPFK